MPFALNFTTMGESLSADITHHIDDIYFSALSHGDETHDFIPISDESYAIELQLQEVLFSAITVSAQPVKRARTDGASSSSSSTSSSKPSLAQLLFCKICMDTVPADEVFQKNNACTHVFCQKCLSRYLGTKIQENILVVKCPEEDCKAVLEPKICEELLPPEVFERWEIALCESMLLGSQKFYCPFKDCSALMADDGDETVTCTECPSCRRLFCASCKVAWHLGLSCQDYGKLGTDERGKDDLLMMQVAREKKWRRCPHCKYYVEKKEGCLHITCRCGFQFCYGCGNKWGVTHACCST